MRIFQKIISALVVILAVFLSLEFLSRFVISSRSPIERQFPVSAARHPKPYTMFGGLSNGQNMQEMAIKGSLNRLGYRGPVPKIVKEQNEFRIVILGGSTVLIGNPTIPELLEKKFQDNGFENVRVYNFGVISSVSGMDLVRILMEVSDYKPDLVIMYGGGNDIVTPISADPRPGYPFNFIAFENNPLLESQVENYPLIPLVLYASNILRVVLPDYFVKTFVPIEQVRQDVRWRTQEWQEEIANVYLTHVKKAETISRAFGARFIAFFQPMVYYKIPLAKEEKAIGQNEFSAEINEIRQKILKSIKIETKNGPLKIHDLSFEFDGNQNAVFYDHIHTFQRYVPQIADRIYEHIIADLGAVVLKK